MKYWNSKCIRLSMYDVSISSIWVSGAATIIPFLSSMSKQRGYSSIIVGLIFTMLPIFGLLLKPIVGVITDKYKCHNSIIVLINIVNCIVVCVLIIIPGQTVENELKDMDVIKSPLFWLFSCCLITLMTGSFMKNVVDDTICMGLLGKNNYQT